MGCILKGGGGLYSRVAVGAVLLAAGSGSRMGHRPKSLLELGGVPLIRRQLIALSGAGVDEVVVVLGHYAELIEDAVKEFPVTLVRNPDPDAGQISSLRLGLQALSPKLDAALVALISRPVPLVALAWGRDAQSAMTHLGNHASVRVIESAHPSPLSASRGFFGSRPFSRASAALVEFGLQPIDWSL
jgi:CTP:molybdopterin cytidylyltransferase MocA